MKTKETKKSANFKKLEKKILSQKIRLFLHLGPHKTGTTQIQTYLHENYSKLKARGIYYRPIQPSTALVTPSHCDLIKQIENACLVQLEGEDSNPGEFSSLADYIEKTIMNYPDINTLIISSEQLVNWDIERLKLEIELINTRLSLDISLIYTHRDTKSHLKSLVKESLVWAELDDKKSVADNMLELCSTNDISPLYLQRLSEICSDAECSLHILEFNALNHKDNEFYLLEEFMGFVLYKNTDFEYNFHECQLDENRGKSNFFLYISLLFSRSISEIWPDEWGAKERQWVSNRLVRLLETAAQASNLERELEAEEAYATITDLCESTLENTIAKHQQLFELIDDMKKSIVQKIQQ